MLYRRTIFGRSFSTFQDVDDVFKVILCSDGDGDEEGEEGEGGEEDEVGEEEEDEGHGEEGDNGDDDDDDEGGDNDEEGGRAVVHWPNPDHRNVSILRAF